METYKKFTLQAENDNTYNTTAITHVCGKFQNELNFEFLVPRIRLSFSCLFCYQCFGIRFSLILFVIYIYLSPWSCKNLCLLLLFTEAWSRAEISIFVMVKRVQPLNLPSDLILYSRSISHYVSVNLNQY